MTLERDARAPYAAIFLLCVLEEKGKLIRVKEISKEDKIGFGEMWRNIEREKSRQAKYVDLGDDAEK